MLKHMSQLQNSRPCENGHFESVFGGCSAAQTPPPGGILEGVEPGGGAEKWLKRALFPWLRVLQLAHIPVLFLCTAAFAQETSLPSSGMTCCAAPSAQHQEHSASKNGEPLPFHQGDDPLPTHCICCNAPAGILLQRSACDWRADSFFETSFLYYYAQEEGLTLASSGQVVNPSGSTYLATTSIANGQVLNQNFAYNPAFKAALGFNSDDWKFQGEYTWIRQNTYTNSDAPASIPSNIGVPIWIANNWFEQTNSVSGQSLAGGNIQSHWHLAMDLADLTAGRPFYLGKKLTVSSYGGLRGAWIRQKVHVDLTTASLLTSNTQYFIHSSNYSNCWGVGPIAGATSAALLGAGFRLEAAAAASLLYTVYTKISHSENGATGVLPPTIGVERTDVKTLRPELNFNLGVAWGSYLSGQRYHIDFKAGYDFIIFWNQNMIRQLLDETTTGVSPSPNNLYLEGLNVTARFDF